MGDTGAIELRSTDQRFYGVATALVVDNRDPAGRGRVKVRFPWLDSAATSDWSRISNLYAGSDYGSFFIPEVDSEVLVAFINGDIRLPVILGGLYNGRDLPPTTREGNEDQKILRTRARHELLLDDTAGQEAVKITTKAGHIVKLDDAGRKVMVETSGGQRMTMDDAGGAIIIETSTGASILMDASGVTITASTIRLNASSVELGGSNGHPVVLGPALLAAFNAHTHTSAIPMLATGPPAVQLTAAVLSTASKAV